MVLAIVLGGRAESSFRQAMIGSQGDLSVFWSNPLVGTICALAMIMLFWPLISRALAQLLGRFRAERLRTVG
jgi:putative tricarboxylic transport membrane protein